MSSIRRGAHATLRQASILWLVGAALLVAGAGLARGEAVGYAFVDGLSLVLEGQQTTTGTWTDDERQKVDRYFAKLSDIAPQLVRKINKGSALGPVFVLRANSRYWSVGYAKQIERGQPTYLILSDNFFEAYDQDSDQTGYDGGNYTLWFFVHEAVHLAELRTSAVGQPLVARDTSNIVGWTIAMKLATANKKIEARGLDPGAYAKNLDKSDIDIIHTIGLPTKYALRTPNETLAEVVTATILAPNYKPPVDIQMAIDAFLKD